MLSTSSGTWNPPLFIQPWSEVGFNPLMVGVSIDCHETYSHIVDYGLSVQFQREFYVFVSTSESGESKQFLVQIFISKPPIDFL